MPWQILEVRALLDIERRFCGRGQPPGLRRPESRPPEVVFDSEELPVLWALHVCNRMLEVARGKSKLKELFRQTFKDLPTQEDLRAADAPDLERAPQKEMENVPNDFGITLREVRNALGGNQLPGKPRSPQEVVERLEHWGSFCSAALQIVLFGSRQAAPNEVPDPLWTKTEIVAWRIFHYFYDTKDTWLSPLDRPGERISSSGKDKGRELYPNFHWAPFHRLDVPARYVELGSFYRRAAEFGTDGLILNISGFSKFYGGARDISAIHYIWSGFGAAVEAGATVLYVSQCPLDPDVKESLVKVCAKVRKYCSKNPERVRLLLLKAGEAVKHLEPAEEDRTATRKTRWSHEYFARQWRYTAVGKTTQGVNGRILDDATRGRTDNLVGIRTALLGGVLHRATDSSAQEAVSFWNWVSAIVVPKLVDAHPVLDSSF